MAGGCARTSARCWRWNPIWRRSGAPLPLYREKTPELPRSGTIPVEQIVSSHPWVIGAGELPFWRQQAIAVDEADHPGTIDEAAARRLAGEYLAVLRRSSATAARVIDKMPFNFLWIGLARLALPHARFIHCRRHPVDTCRSIYCTSLESLRGFVGDRDDLVFFYREYIRLMEHWRAVLPADRFIDVDYEFADRRSGDAGSADDRLLRARMGCGLSPPRGRPPSGATASKWQARQPVYRSSVERWRRYEPWLNFLRDLMPSQP